MYKYEDIQNEIYVIMVPNTAELYEPYSYDKRCWSQIYIKNSHKYGVVTNTIKAYPPYPWDDLPLYTKRTTVRKCHA